MNSVQGDWELPQPSFLIRKSPDQRSFASFPEHIAGYHVLLRFSMPRHPPYTLKSLTTFIDHRHAASLRPSEPKPCGPAGRAERPTARTGTARSITDQQSPKRCSTTSARQKDQSSGGGSTLAGADIAEVSSFQMNLLLNLKIHSLVKERLAREVVGLRLRFSRQVFPPNAGESAVASLC